MEIKEFDHPFVKVIYSKEKITIQLSKPENQNYSKLEFPNLYFFKFLTF
jgi:hypothetical protein